MNSSYMRSEYVRELCTVPEGGIPSSRKLNLISHRLPAFATAFATQSPTDR